MPPKVFFPPDIFPFFPLKPVKLISKKLVLRVGDKYKQTMGHSIKRNNVRHRWSH